MHLGDAPRPNMHFNDNDDDDNDDVDVSPLFPLHSSFASFKLRSPPYFSFVNGTLKKN